MIEVHHGCSRMVILVGRWAIKVPQTRYGWSNFLTGLLCNVREGRCREFPCPEVCPVVLYVPGGFLSVMPRARPLTDEEWAEFDPEGFCEREDYVVPAEHKRCSFGVMPDGRMVAVDYGD